MEYEIIEALQDKYGNNDIQTQLECLLYLQQRTGNRLFQNEINKLCTQHDLCPYCFGQLTYETHKERHGDNYTYDETVTDVKCMSCGREF